MSEEATPYTAENTAAPKLEQPILPGTDVKPEQAPGEDTARKARAKSAVLIGRMTHGKSASGAEVTAFAIMAETSANEKEINAAIKKLGHGTYEVWTVTSRREKTYEAKTVDVIK